MTGTGTDLISGGSSTNTTNVINTLAYRGFGGVKSLNFGSNPRLMQISYDAKRQQMTNLYIRRTSNTGSDNVIVNSDYDYYNGGANNGRIQKITDNTDATYTTTYGYDAYNRLTSATATAFTRSYGYDNWGNLTGVTATGAGETGSYSLSYATNGSGAPSTNRINNSGFSYDNAGNLTAGDGWSYTYDAANRLKAVGASGNTYGYDGDGQKVKQDTGGYGNLYYIWSSVLGQPVVEATTGGVYRAYVYGPSGQSLGLLSYDGGFYWVHSDHLGSGRKLTDVNGNVVYRGEFDPHGQTMLEVAPGGSYLNSKKYTGYERNWATNLDDANARTYHHNRARFMQPDPLGLGAADTSDPESLNRYSYVGNDPVNFVDPSGLFLAAPQPTPDELCSLGFGQYCSRLDSGVLAFFLSSWYRSYGGGGGGGGTDGGGGGGQDPQAPPKPSCTIQFYDRLIEYLHGIPIPGARHGYIVFTESGGTQHYFEGYRDTSNKPTTLTAKDSDPKNLPLKKDIPAKDHLAGQTSGPEVCDWLDTLKQAVSTVNAANIKYNFLGPNSTSVDRYMLQSLPDTTWFHRRFMVGWGARLPGVEP